MPRRSCYETPTFTAAEAGAVESTLASNLPAGSWSDNRGERSVGARTEVDAHLSRDRCRHDAGGATGDAEARRRGTRLQLQSLRASRAAALRAARARADASASESTAASSSTSQPTPSAPPPPDDVAAGAAAGGTTTGAMTATDKVVLDTKPPLSVVVSWRTNEPAAVGETTTESALVALVIVAPVLPALRIAQA